MILIIGAGGHSKEIWDILSDEYQPNNCFFYDDCSEARPSWIPEQAIYINNVENIKTQLSNGLEFVLAIGSPLSRFNFFKKISSFGGIVKSVVSANATISKLSTILPGVNIMHNCIVQPYAKIGRCVLLNAGSIIHHDSYIGEFAEIGPGTIVTGNCTIGQYTAVGAGVVLKPGITVGNNCIIGAGSVVTKNIPDNQIAYGIPAKIIKANNRIET